MDGRKNNGGNKGCGRKPKAQEFKAYEKGAKAMKAIYGSVDKFWEHIATESKLSFPHLKLLVEYTYGKAPETYKFEGEVGGIQFVMPPKEEKE